MRVLFECRSQFRVLDGMCSDPERLLTGFTDGQQTIERLDDQFICRDHTAFSFKRLGGRITGEFFRLPLVTSCMRYRVSSWALPVAAVTESPRRTPRRSHTDWRPSAQVPRRFASGGCVRAPSDSA